MDTIVSRSLTHGRARGHRLALGALLLIFPISAGACGTVISQIRDRLFFFLRSENPEPAPDVDCVLTRVRQITARRFPTANPRDVYLGDLPSKIWKKAFAG